MLEEVAERIWPSAFEELLRYWIANALRLTRERMLPELLDEELDAVLTAKRKKEDPVLSSSGDVCVRARDDGGFDCWCGTVGEYPVGIKVFVRIEATGVWRPEGTATWEVVAPPGDDSKGDPADGLAAVRAKWEAKGFVSFLLEKGRVLPDE